MQGNRVSYSRDRRGRADDVIATIVKIAKEEGYSCVISSLDKDLMQLVEDPAVI